MGGIPPWYSNINFLGIMPGSVIDVRNKNSIVEKKNNEIITGRTGVT